LTNKKKDFGPFSLTKYHSNDKLCINNIMFNDTKYTATYFKIIEKAKDRPITGYTENHHILPESMGGSLDSANMVRLTAREHFICHWLLTKMTAGADYHSMIHALNGMKRMNKSQERYNTKITSRVYARIKPIAAKIHSEFMTGKVPHNKGIPRTDAQKQAQSEKMLGRQLTPDQLARSIAKRTGMKRTQESKDKISASLTGIKRPPRSEEEKKKRSLSLLGRKKPDGFGEKVAARMKETFTTTNPNKRDDLKKVCVYCGLTTGPTNYSRWHGDNCKLKAT
jgi:hypothetical protein